VVAALATTPATTGTRRGGPRRGSRSSRSRATSSPQAAARISAAASHCSAPVSDQAPVEPQTTPVNHHGADVISATRATSRRP
jgi:hypothetical protein